MDASQNDAMNQRPAAMGISAQAGPTAAQTHAFLLRTAELLHRHGTPSYRLERVMTKVSRTLGVVGVFLYTPTALVVSLGDGTSESTYLRRVDSGEVDIGKLLAFDGVLEDLEAGTLSIAEASDQLETAAAAPAYYGRAATLLAACVASAGVAILFGGGGVETLTASVLGLLIAGLAVMTGQMAWERGLLEPLAGFLVALLALATAHWICPLDDRLTTLAALILMVPGLTLTVALTELAMGHLSAGSARLAGASVALLTLVLGVAIAWRIGDGWRNAADAPVWPLPDWALWIAVATAPAAFAVLFRAPPSQWGVIFLVGVAGFVASRVGGLAIGPEGGAFAGALVVGCGSNLYARLYNRPTMVAQTPGLLILVPGSIGYRSLTALLESQTVHGVQLAFTMVMVGLSLVGGLLSASLILPPRRIL